MFLPLLIHLVVWILGAWLLGHALGRVLAYPRPHGGWLALGLGFTAYLGALLIWPFLFPGRGNATLIRWVGSHEEAWAGKALVLGVVFLLLWGAFRLLRLWAGRRKLRRLLLNPEAMAVSGSAWAEEESFRSAVETQFREALKRPLRVRYGARLVLPETLGAWPPVILLPHWLVRHPELHASAKVLLNREREHIRLGQAWWTELLAWIAAALPPLAPMKTALDRAMAARAEASLLAQGTPEAAARYQEAVSGIRASAPNFETFREPPPTRRIRLAWGAALVLVAPLLAWPARWTSPVNWRDAGQVLSLKLPQGFRVAIEPPGLEIRPLPGVGGDFPEGVMVDTRRVKNHGISHMGLRFPVPPADRPVLRLRLHYRVTGISPVAPRLRMEALRWSMLPGPIAVSEVMDQDMADFTAPQGWAEVSACLPPDARVDPKSEVAVWFSVQPGTRLEITQIHSSTEPGMPRSTEENRVRQANWEAFLARHFDLPAFNSGWHSLSEED